jgi:hypothetical protein
MPATTQSTLASLGIPTPRYPFIQNSFYVPSKMYTGHRILFISYKLITSLLLVLQLKVVNSDGFYERFVVFGTAYREFRLTFNPSVMEDL